ncbi:MAG: hypothetical protein KKH52_04105 [Nanoarchaeota archaeon]|nr:hypothetical protein [Nanoarchaeota archaeon]MBU1622012.1 hypothetical protein [Nanoarchaeota archaeon]MBU1974553.1 hypothetical protein [Nanoarchaeota archaeon]
MKISFFEEFPTKGNLAKLKLVDWPSTIFCAAESLAEFKQIKSSVKKKNVKLAYWPILKKNEGYWMSPFSSPKGLKRIIKELEQERKMTILWDAELPYTHPFLFMRNGLHFFTNRMRIKKFLKRKGKDLTIYSAQTFTFAPLFRFLGVHFDKYVTAVPMCYASFLPGARMGLKQTEAKVVGIGLIAKGIGPTDQVYTAQALEKDLNICKQKKIKEVIIFRLGGLNKNYLKVLKKFK